MRTVTLFVLLIFHSLVTGESAQSYTLNLNITSNVQHVTTRTQVLKVILDESSSSSNGALIVGARNEILKIDASTLSLEDFWRNGPVVDPTTCSLPATQCDDNNEQNNDNHVVLMHNSTPVNVITCGTIKHGMCSILQYKNLSKAGWIGDPSEPINYVSSQKYTLALPIKTTRDASSSSYVIGHEYDDRALELSPPTLSVRRMKALPRPAFDYFHNGKVNSTIRIRSDLKQSYRIEYIYGFSDDHYFYIVTNQMIPDGNYSEARIARVCLNDTTLTTYTELRLECDEPPESRMKEHLSLATAAHHEPLLPSGFLHIAFSSEKSRLNSKSMLCSIEMSHLARKFDNATDDCMDGGDRVSMHPAYDNQLASPPNQQDCLATRWKNNHYCEPRSTNFYILSKEYVPMKPYNILANTSVTSLTTYTSNASRMALVGTRTGEIIKITLGPDSKELFRQDFSTPWVGSSEVQPEPAVDGKENSAYLAVSNRIVKFPLQSCSIYAKCSKCLSVQDPLACGWCGNTCASKSECSSVLSQSCPPVINDFHPRNGPTRGGTEITIIGDNFGTSSSNTSLEVDIIGESSFSECHLKNRQNEKVVCITPNSAPLAGQLRVKVKKPDGADEVGQSNAQFSFLDFNVSAISPSFSPSSGGAVLRITGHNLHIGGRRSVEIISAGQKALANCTINSVGEEEIYCTMGAIVDSTDVRGNLSVIIDDDRKNTTISFTFKRDPIVHRIYPSESPLTTRINITIIGDHLDSIASPVLQMNGQPGKLALPCITVNSTLIYCQLPSLDASWKHTTATLRLTNNASSIVDVEDSSIFLQPDPWFSSSLDPVVLDDMNLEIRGQDICLANEMTITVGADKTPCKVIKSDIHRLTCKIDSRGLELSSNDSLTVNWKLGEMERTLGQVTFIEKTETAMSSWLIVAVVFFLGVIVGILIWLKRSAPSKKEYGRVAYIPESRGNNSPVSNDYCSTGGRNRNSHVILDSDEEYQELVSQLQAANKFIAREHLIRGDIIGVGYFAEVHKGTLEEAGKGTRTVAIKTLKSGSPSVMKEFLREAVVMKDLKHDNILPLVGVAFFEKTNMPALVLPFMGKKDLLKYVRNEEYEPTVRQLLTFTLDIARGMDYLNGQKIVHRDLAARNCMLDDNLNVYVADFGLSRDVYEKNYYSSEKTGPLPCKWMALESLRRGTFTSKSDVWSYGVTSWEVISRGLIPYIEISQNLIEHLSSGKRLPEPSVCPEAIYNLWTLCWHSDPNKRPSFAEIIDQIEDFFKQASKRSLEQKVPSDSGYKNIANGKYYNETDDVTDLQTNVPVGNCYT